MAPQGSKSSYTSKQRRQARHIEESVKRRGGSSKKAARIAYATVNKQDKGGKRSGSGRGRSRNASAARKGGRKGGRKAGGRAGRATRPSGGRKKASTRRASSH